MNRQLEQVKEFRTKFKIGVSESLILLPKERLLLHHKMLQEELDELKEAIDNDDIVGIADAVTDIDYLSHGLKVESGITAEVAIALFDEVQASNMSKLGIDGNPIYRDDGKIMKGPNYFVPDLASIVNRAIEKAK